MVNISAKELYEQSIYFFIEEINTLVFFEENEKGYFLKVDEENKDDIEYFSYYIEENKIIIKSNKDNTTYGIKIIKQKEDYFIVNLFIKKENDKQKFNEIKFHYEFLNEDDFQPVSNFDIFNSLDKKNKYFIISFFVFIIILIFLLISNLAILKNLHFVLQLMLTAVLFLVLNKMLFLKLLTKITKGK